MAPKTKRKCIADALEDLEPEDLEKFRRQLLDRKVVKRNKVNGKTYLEIADVLVSTYTEDGAVPLTEELLKEIGCLDVAKEFAEDVRAQSAQPGSGGGDGGATGGGSMADEEHFVDKHKKALTNRVSNLAPILDDLLIKKVIQQEMYDEIRKLPTNQQKMREIFSGCLKGGKSCKDIFYRSLEENEKYLMDDLKNK